MRAPLKSRRSTAEHLFHHFIPFGAACIGNGPIQPPVYRRHTITSVLESCRRCAAEMIAPLSGCDLFMSPIKLLSPHIVVRARHQRTEEGDTSSDYMAQ